MSKTEMMKRCDEIYAKANSEGREINDDELAEIEELTDLIYANLDH